MLKIKLVYNDKREELCRFSTLPEAGQALVVDGLTYHVLEINRALSNTDPEGPDAIVRLSTGSDRPADNSIPRVDPGPSR